MTGKQVRAQYTQEFKLEAVRQVRAGQVQSVVAKVLGIPKASLGSWVRQAAKGEWRPVWRIPRRTRSRLSKWSWRG